MFTLTIRMCIFPATENKTAVVFAGKPITLYVVYPETAEEARKMMQVFAENNPQLAPDCLLFELTYQEILYLKGPQSVELPSNSLPHGTVTPCPEPKSNIVYAPLVSPHRNRLSLPEQKEIT